MLTRGTVVIDVEACKGCDLCIDACPPRVLVMTEHIMNSRGYRYPLLLAGCTGCRTCAQICPDFVFQVYKYDTPIQLEVQVEGAWTTFEVTRRPPVSSSKVPRRSPTR